MALYLKSSHAKTTLGMKMKFDFKLEILYIFWHLLNFLTKSKLYLVASHQFVEILYFNSRKGQQAGLLLPLSGFLRVEGWKGPITQPDYATANPENQILKVLRNYHKL